MSPIPVQMVQPPTSGWPQLRDLGAMAERNDDPMRLLQGKKSPAHMLGRLLQELVPLIESFRNPTSRRQTWWRRFTGEALEREITYLHACQHLESKAKNANDLATEVQHMRATLEREAAVVRRHAQWLEQLVTNGQTVLGGQHAAARANACFAAQPDYWARFARRIDNLNALQHALLLSVEQYKLADAHGQALLDRHSDIVTVLVPLWRQRMGFELFSKTVAPPQE